MRRKPSSWLGVVPVERAVSALIERQRAALLTDELEAGRYALLDAAAILAESFPCECDNRPVVQLLFAKAAHQREWSEQSSSLAAGSPAIDYVSYRTVAVRPEAIAPGATLLLDTRGLTRDKDTTLWRAMVPVIRSHPRVLLYIERTDWPKHLVHVEWLGHMDKTLVSLNSIDVHRALRSA